MPNMPAAPTTCIRFAPATLRERRIRSGISGCAAVCSRSTNPASSTDATAAQPSVGAALQPCSAAGLTIV